MRPETTFVGISHNIYSVNVDWSLALTETLRWKKTVRTFAPPLLHPYCRRAHFGITLLSKRPNKHWPDNAVAITESLSSVESSSAVFSADENGRDLIFLFFCMML